MGDQEPDVNNHIYEEHYLASDDDNVVEDFDFPDNDTLYDGDTNHTEDENHFVDEDIEVNIDFSEDDIKPKVTSKFNSYGEAVTMYRNYALESVFDVRHLEEYKKRKMGLLQIDIFYAIRKEIFIHNLSKQNIGPVKAHRLYSALQVGPSVRGGLVSDFKNARKNLNCYIGGRDAKFLVDKMNDRTKNVPSFTFEYKVLNKRLNALFWADETAKYNYNSFEDVLSFDATFSMNKYDMVFVPFSGIDNHKKCVTFGAGLLSKEDGVSYEWLLRDFLKAFRKQPQLVISDQDPALKKAIDKVFPFAHHRLCMCHITKKLPNKVTHSTKDGSFRCSCMHFEHVGILCRHIFCVFKFYGIEQIPKKYILKRWRRDVIPAELLKRHFNSSFDDSNSDMIAIDIFSTVDHDCPTHDVPNRSEQFKKLLGVHIRNKGSGSHGKRLKSTKEMTEKEISKAKRKCATCQQMVHHDKRNRPLKNAEK
uniref:SWIM-type domain-containing protein n=1 Tax=Lactuca sativa TaxID=4236 RepID=A0A9R1VNN8_LACSA|nr:hypothetical protein LSAT_V11C400182840 [Lactuca sativa]